MIKIDFTTKPEENFITLMIVKNRTGKVWETIKITEEELNLYYKKHDSNISAKDYQKASFLLANVGGTVFYEKNI